MRKMEIMNRKGLKAEMRYDSDGTVHSVFAPINLGGKIRYMRLSKGMPPWLSKQFTSIFDSRQFSWEKQNSFFSYSIANTVWAKEAENQNESN